MSVSITQLRAEGRYPEALALALSQLPASPENGSLLHLIASLHDVQGLEQQAIPYYQAAINHLPTGRELQEAYLGLGSSYRALGQYAESLATFDQGLLTFPDAKDLKLFRAMTCYNLGENHQAVSDLLLLLAETSAHPDIQRYQRAIRYYAQDLDHID